MIGLITETTLLLLGLVFRWPLALVICGVIRGIVDNNGLMALHPNTRSPYIRLLVIKAIFAFIIGVLVFTKLGFDIAPAILGGYSATGIIAEILFMAGVYK